MKRLGGIWKQSLFRWGLISISIAAALLFQDVMQLNKDTVEIHKNPTESNKRVFDASLARVQAITGGIGTVATIVGGITLYLNFRVANRNAEIAEDQQVTERFSKAIDQLANKEHLQVRLGGIYSLERIAKDSSEDLWTIVEVLSSFIRQYTATQPSSRKPPSLIEAVLQNQTLNNRERTKLPTDIQAAFTVIDRIYKQRTNDRMIDLKEINLCHTDLSCLNFSKSNLYRANLSRANLNDADLSRANLNDADLSHAYLGGANLSGTQLSESNLSKAHLEESDLSSAEIRSANLSGANLYNANLRGADLSYTDLRKANLDQASLFEAEFYWSDLRGANLSNALSGGKLQLHGNLRGANLSNAYLSGTNFSGFTESHKGSDLSGAVLRDTFLDEACFRNSDLSGADFSGANLSNANLSNANLSGAVLSNANLSGTDLNGATLQGAILLASDLSNSNLQRNQLIESNAPLLCATKLPNGIEDLSDRDCVRLPQVLLDRYPDTFKTLDEAKQYVEDARKR